MDNKENLISIKEVPGWSLHYKGRIQNNHKRRAGDYIARYKRFMPLRAFEEQTLLRRDTWKDTF